MCMRNRPEEVDNAKVELDLTGNVLKLTKIKDTV